MNLQDFLTTYKNKKNADQVIIACANGDKCVHPSQSNIEISKAAAIKNFRKHGEEKFVCRKCDMHYDNPMNKVGQGKRSKDKLELEIDVLCPICLKSRRMKTACYTGSLEREPYLQIDGTCAQLGKVISEEQKEAIRQALKGKPLSEDHKQKILEFRKNNPEWAEKANKNLIPGIGGGWNTGMQTPQEVKDKQSKAMIGVKKTLEHKYHISVGRKKMLDETGGFTREHRENISKATVLQYQKGFEPKLYHRSGYHFSPKMNKKLHYKSSYEKKVYLLLDADDSILSYEYESLKIEYYNPIKKNTGIYIIDLKVNYKDGRTIYIEIKPAKLLLEENKSDMAVEARAKVEEACKKLPEMELYYDIWTEVHLFGPIDTEKKIREFVEWLDKQPEQLNKGNSTNEGHTLSRD